MISVKELERAKTPESVGITSNELIELIKDFEKTEYHGFMVIRHGKVAAEWFRYPYSVNTPHALYSVSKSITAIAAGFAVTEGLLNLNDKVVDFFPDLIPRKIRDDLNKVTLKHLITLTAGRNISVLANRAKVDWLKLFMDSKQKFEPGDKFEYVNDCFYMAAAMIQKATGKTVVEYLKPRLFEPLGIETPFWETDKRGIEAGGWGLFMSPEDLAKIGVCYLNDGYYDGKSIIPREWIEESIKNHKGPHAPVTTNHTAAYGYGVWRRKSADGPYRFDGIFGQVVEFFKDYDCVCVMVGGEVSFSSHECIYRHFPQAFIDIDTEAPPNEELLSQIKKIGYPPLPKKPRSEIENKINGKTIHFKKNLLLNIIGYPMSVLPHTETFMTKDRAGNIDNVKFRFFDDYAELSWVEGDEKNTVICGIEGDYRTSPIKLAGKNYTAFSSAGWENINTLKVLIRPVEGVSSRIMVFRFEGRRVRMYPSSDHPIAAVIDSVKNEIISALKSEKLALKLINVACRIIEPVHKGHFIGMVK
jgi:CubicO group peptidase (beta-lactamase class C family)